MNFWIGPIFKNYSVIMIETLKNDQTLKLTIFKSRIRTREKVKKNSSICYKGKLFFDCVSNSTCIIITTRLNKHLKLLPELLELVLSVEPREPKWLFTIAPKGGGEGDFCQGEREILPGENRVSVFLSFFSFFLLLI